MNKHIIRFLLMVTMLLTMLPPMASAADVDTLGEGDFTYKVLSESDATEEVKINDSSISGDIEIPSTVTHNDKTYNVTAISKEGFRGCSNLTSITIPDSVTSIGNSAFQTCQGLTSVRFLRNTQ